MNTIKHKIFGTGKEISRETQNERTYVTVRFINGREMRMVIPESFENVNIEVDGPLKDEIESAKAEKSARINEKVAAVNERRSAAISARIPRHPRRTPPAGSVVKDFEDYLIKAGYKRESESGNRSTVDSYLRALEAVRHEENVTYSFLARNISSIAAKYDIGGDKVDFGNKSNRTYINALRRFEDFINSL